MVKELVLENGMITKDTDDFLESKFNFFSPNYILVLKLTDKMNDLLSNINKSVSHDDVEICDTEIKDEKIILAIIFFKQMSNNKSPEGDGLTLEFYRTFYDVFRWNSNKLIYKEIEKQGHLLTFMIFGLMGLIYKKRGDKRHLNNYRLITLLTVDYKIMARIIAKI